MHKLLKMEKLYNMKNAQFYLDAFFGSLLGVNLINLTTEAVKDGSTLINNTTDVFQLIGSIIGLLYFLSMWLHKKNTRKESLNGLKLDNQIKKEQLEKLERENNNYE